ncbi:DegT/DnrJ/EryC1/StrS family aminotransferase [Methylomarinum vadi]|uniref:DegT/DnrJ/EryC1/StrS family aminotransferase n=1 Tax=Methylomarinum vadi TaxID=438855 RepID=UPI0004DEFE73|nr:DegT/DnrJ/EryC1/StrS family aminotransferase [Methylomarinum vadi]
MTKSIIPHSRPWITSDDRKSVNAILASRMIAHGEKVSQFEEKVCKFLDINHAVAQSSGSAALVLALKTLQITRGDEVILPTYVCRSVLEAVLSVGAEPIFCDVDYSGVITSETVKPNITQKTKAIIAVHIFGHLCDVEQLKSLGLLVIEDACQAFGLHVSEKMAGSLGDVGILSFHATKCLTTGEGGMLVTNNHNWGEMARILTDGDVSPNARHIAPLSDLQAALGLAQLSRYDESLERRQRLRSQFTKVASEKGITMGASDDSDMLFRFTLRNMGPFDVIQSFFLEQGIQVRRGVDELLHRTMGMSDQHFPVAVDIFTNTASIPFYPSLSKRESETICQAIRKFHYDH